ncbi:hypothetical protein LCGC14_2295110, partial [marine sediment metagenome]
MSNGKRAKIKIMPDQLVEIALERLKAQNFTMELKEIRYKNEQKVIYNIEANKTGRFLGIFKMKLKLEGQIDPETGEFIRINKPWWAFLVAGENSDQVGEKTTLCHIPPGDPSAAHTISVGAPAVNAHLGRHGGDTLGACSGGEGNETSPPEGNETGVDESPQWFDNSTNSTVNGTLIEHRVMWTDDNALSGYIFSFDNGTGTFVNDSFVAMSGTEDWSNVSKVVNSTVGSTIRWRVSANDTSGNTNNTENRTYTINQATTSLNLVITPSTSETYGTETTSTGSNCPSQLTCTLYRDGVAVSNPDTVNLTAGTYNYTYNTTGNTNYTTDTNTTNLIINKETGVVFTYLDNSRANKTIEQFTEIYLNSTLETGSGTIKLYNNGTLINQGTSPLSNLTNFTATGLYNITTTYDGNENYTSAFETWYVNVTEADVTSPQISVVYPTNINYTAIQTQLNYTASDNIGLDTCWYSLDSGATNITIETCGQNVTNLDSGQGSSTWKVYVNDTVGNENSSSVTFFVDSIKPTIQFVSPTETSGDSLGRNYILVNVTATDTNLDTITIRLYNSTSLVQTNLSSISQLFV